MTAAELISAVRGHRPPRGSPLDLLALLALDEWDTAAQLLRGNTGLIAPSSGVLHLMAKRNGVAAVRWLLEHGADPNGRWAHWDADVTPLHLAAWHGHAGVVRLLLEAGADPTIHDSKHHADAIGWAEFFGQADIARMLKTHTAKS
jgi:ankyrin repeat protein